MIDSKSALLVTTPEAGEGSPLQASPIQNRLETLRSLVHGHFICKKKQIPLILISPDGFLHSVTRPVVAISPH